ncbi:hypothetical protein IWQ60_002279 [Tieghemiomyces parasiticus]|uniref:Acylamino-acid-releasing enzyme n=1 Tax=Tieghemiomyces parasiticus TaxID=78921 RepID=A0A9W8E1S7_9FUNG|nr:hypothetical protein IWQ60_002279 [Tieghemiomyces parasiticus]
MAPTHSDLVQRLYEQARLTPAVSSAHVFPTTDHTLTISVTTSQADPVRQTRRSVTHQQVIRVEADPEAAATGAPWRLEALATTVPTEQVGVSLQAWSPTHRHLAVLRNVSDGETNKPRRFVEVWTHNALTQTVEVTDVHGGFYVTYPFGQLSWSRDETRLVYLAERKPTEDAHTKFDYVPDYGEGFTGNRAPALVLVDLPAGHARVLDLGLDQQLGPGQPVFGPGDTSLIFTGYQQGPQPVGVVYCFNRPISIYQLDLAAPEARPVRLTDTASSARSPRLTPDGTRLVYLVNPRGGAHNRCTGLAVHDFRDGHTRSAVSVVNDPSPDRSDGFPGLYLTVLPTDPWCLTPDRPDWLVCASAWGSRTTLLMIHLGTGRVVNLTPDPRTGSWAFLDATRNLLVASQSTPAQPHHLQLGVVSFNDQDTPSAHWLPVPDPTTAASPARDLTELIQWETVSFAERYPGLEGILVRPADESKTSSVTAVSSVVRRASTEWRAKVSLTGSPLMVFPHGGPHSVSTTEFSWLTAAFALAGFAVLFTNYRGSVGFGQDFVDSLIGEIGDLEVEDVHVMGQTVLARHAELHLDPKRVFHFGGSHGGFIGAHLSARYPDAYQAVCLRNPVINIGSMAAATDIPDWCHFESGVNFDYPRYNLVGPELYQRMFDNSPLRHVDRVRAPTLLLLGEGDRRVPPSQGKTWYAGLIGQTTTTSRPAVEIKAYPKVGHPLDTVEVEGSCFFHTVRFFMVHGYGVTWDS